MAGIGLWRRLAKDVVTIEPYVSQDKYGNETFGAGTSYPARCVGKVRQIMTGTGQLRTSMVTTYLLGTPTVTPRDRITLPPDFVPRQPPILGIQREHDQNGQHHIVVLT